MRLLVAALLLAGTVGRAQSPTVTISGRVLGGSGTHTVRVALWDAEGFLRKAVQEVRLDASGRFSFAVRPGRWAVSAYEDRNENGVLDMGLFGPKEPAGFWRRFGGWHKPRFDEVASDVGRDVTGADVTLK